MSKLIALLLIVFTITTKAQTPLSDSRQTSALQYLYKISNQEAVAFSQKKIRSEKTESLLHTLIDSFAFKTPIPTLPPGHYLIVYAIDNQLQLSLHTVPNCQLKIINNYRDLAVLIHDSLGQPITNAKVLLRRKALTYDANTTTYRLTRSRKNGLLQVQYNDVWQFYPLNNSLRRRGNFWQKVKGSFPVKQISQWLKPKRKGNRYPDYFRDEAPYQQKFHAYFVFNKPIYKPGDTLHFKAYIVPKKGKPANRPLLLRLTDRNFDKDTIIATVYPYRPGGYEGQVILSDSFDLDLDSEYLLTLEELSSRRYNLEDYEGDLDDDEYALQRKIVAKGHFEFEEYELGQMQFKTRTDKAANSPGTTVSVFAETKDENDLPVADGRLQITVLRDEVRQCYVPQLFIPDTLWQHSQPMDAVGETKVALPDSIFPKADFSYKVRVEFLNSNNESKSETIYQTYNYQTQKLLITPKSDSLYITYQYLGRPQPREATITLISENQTMQSFKALLPTTVWLNPFMEKCVVKTDSLKEEYQPQRNTTTIDFYTQRTKDSIFITTNNPQQINFWYTLMANKRSVEKGYSNNISIARKTTTRKNYFLVLQYIWGGRVQTKDYFIPYHTKTLTIEVTQPLRVYPGQQADIQLLVKDAVGNPVADADVTAWAITQKFKNASAPNIPFTSKTYRRLNKKANYRTAYNLTPSTATLLNWQRWSREMGLDSIAYFQFLHPNPIYQSAEPASDSLTQLSPFVIKNGDVQPVHLLYIDEKPVFFSKAEQIRRYSFKVSPGKHALRLRTHNRMIQLDSIWVKAGMMNFLSIEADALDPLVQTTKQPDTLTRHEQDLWSKYMVVINNNTGENWAGLYQDTDVLWLPPNDRGHFNYFNSANDKLVGPLPPNPTLLEVKRSFAQNFIPEPYYSFTFQEGLIKQKSLPTRRLFNSYLQANKPAIDFKDKVLTELGFDSLWQSYLDNRAAKQPLYYNSYLYNNHKLTIHLDTMANGQMPFIKNIFLFRHDDPDFVRIYKGEERELGPQEPGCYKMLLLLKNATYIVCDTVWVKANGYNYFTVSKADVKAKDSMSIRMNAEIDSWRIGQHNNYGRGAYIKETFNDKYFDVQSFTHSFTGQVVDEKGKPIVAAMVTVKGLSIGVLTDAKGQFSLRIPIKGTIVISAVGFETVYETFQGSTQKKITLPDNRKMLSEVVVTGMSTIRKKELTGATSKVVSLEEMLMGQVPGIQFEPGYATGITIRGSNSILGNGSVLYIVDGIPVENIASIDISTAVSVDLLKDAAATALYGSRAANGAIIITTTKGKLMKLDSMASGVPVEDQAALPNTLRKNFKDDGFWQPRLRTNSQGKVQFAVIFPDDITKWRTFYAAMTDNKQTGFAEMAIRSYKPLSANITFPQFLIAGDSSRLIGKVLNYNNDTAIASRNIYINNQLTNQKRLSLTNAHLDTISVIAAAADSVKLKYTIEQANGYFDGEERSIPIFPIGIMETQGLFAVLDKDTSFVLPRFNKSSPVTLYAEASVLPVLLDEIEKVKKYEYYCNEQLASKLKCLLLEKKIRQQQQQPFAEDKNIKALITKLTQNRGRNFMWGWWANNDPSLWITLHVVEALQQAASMGYADEWARQPIIDYLVYNQENFNGSDKIRSLLLLRQLDAKADYKKYADSIAAHFIPQSLHHKLQWIAAQQELGMPVNADSLMRWSSTTMMGNLYWGEDGYRFFDNAIQNTLLAYRILHKQGGYEAQLRKIRYYFLEKRKGGQWRNTYESALILSTILPDLLADARGATVPSFTISGTQNITVDRFPFTLQVSATDNISIQKKAGLPVYFTAWQQYHNPAPQKASEQFEVSTHFTQNGQPRTSLKAGQAISLTATVNVKADADYVMVEIPIPAGCSYKSKQQSYANNEVHREHFKNKVSIFCTSLTKGSYTFTVELMPRYNGLYHLNPAKAEMMYFPIFYGRENMKQVAIE